MYACLLVCILGCGLCVSGGHRSPRSEASPPSNLENPITGRLLELEEEIRRIRAIADNMVEKDQCCLVEKERHKNQALISGPTHWVRDTALASSSNYRGYANHGQQCSRLGAPQPDDCWTFGWTTLPAPDQWIQVDLGSLCTVEGVATQGRGPGADPPHRDWVTSYTLASLDYNDRTVDSPVVTSYKDPQNNRPKVFPGNTDGDTVVRHSLTPPIMAQFVRLNVTGYHHIISLRWELYGYHSTC